MDEAEKALAAWSLGFGDINEKLFGTKGGKRPRRRAIKSDWGAHRMPRTRTRIELGIAITEDEFEELAWGHIPLAMEDHWFMYFDGEAFCFYRSWTGYCIYQVHVVRDKGGFLLDYVTVNRKAEQHGETDDEKDALLVAVLIGEAVGRNVDVLWEAYFSLRNGE